VIGLRKTGASLGSAVAFFLGNPTLNPAVLVFLLFTLGWQWALLRLAFGVLLVFGGAALATRVGGQLDAPAPAIASPSPATEQTGPWAMRWLRAFVGLVIRLVPEYIIVIGILGFARAYLFPAAGPELGNGLSIMLIVALTGTLFAIPTAGEIPIIQTMLVYGIGAGPIGVLLLTLPSTSLPSLLMVWHAFSWRVLVVLGAVTALVGLLAGWTAIALGL
jgi:uncharacterized membrane protein YraQ (UPF0718 family)